MKTFSALLALCAGNSLATGEFPSQRPVTRSFDVFFDLRLNKRLNKQSRRWWFETPSRPLWRQYDKWYGNNTQRRCYNVARFHIINQEIGHDSGPTPGPCRTNDCYFTSVDIWWCHDLQMLSALPALFRGIHRWQLVSDAELCWLHCSMLNNLLNKVTSDLRRLCVHLTSL